MSAKDLAGRVVLVTGASSGIGLEASVVFARRGAEVVLTARDEGRGRTALARVAEAASAAGAPAPSLLLCDFSSLADVRRLAADYRAKHTRLDVLVNNAGGVSDARRVTKDGFEQTFAVNHLAPFLLTHLLLDLLKASAPSRVVVTASVAHARGVIDLDDLHYAKGGYDILKAYARSKLANVLFASELARRLAGTGVSVFSLHPGAVATNIWAGAPWYAKPVLAIAKLFMRSPAQGGDVIVHVATTPGIESSSGAYFDKKRLHRPARSGRDEPLAAKLWEASEKLTGIAG